MDRELVYRELRGTGDLDYEIYLRTRDLLDCQTPFGELINPDELQFQIVHQVEELWMKLLAYTILDIDDDLGEKRTHRARTLFSRCHRILDMMTRQLGLLETMSPKDYQEIRPTLGNGSGQESPGFRILQQIVPQLWPTYQEVYLTGRGLDLEQVYDSEYSHDDAYVLAECLVELDEQFVKFRWHHIFLVHRSIGIDASSLKGSSTDMLRKGARRRFFPELWEVRARMTARWGSAYGRVRPSIGAGNGDDGAEATPVRD